MKEIKVVVDNECYEKLRRSIVDGDFSKIKLIVNGAISNDAFEIDKLFMGERDENRVVSDGC